VALAAAEAFFGAGAATGPIDVETVRAAFASVRSPGRLEAVRSAPTILLDAAHNPHGMAASVAALVEAFDFRRLIGVVGVLADKDVPGLLRPLEVVLDEIVTTQNSSPRALPADALGAVAVEIFGADRVTVEPRLDDAIETAVRLAEESADDILAGAGVLITGSVITAGEARALLVRPGSSPARRMTLSTANLGRTRSPSRAHTANPAASRCRSRPNPPRKSSRSGRRGRTNRSPERWPASSGSRPFACCSCRAQSRRLRWA